MVPREIKQNQVHIADKTRFPSGSVVKSMPARQETRVQFQGQEDPLEKEMATHSKCSFLENPMDRGATVGMGLQRFRHD